MEHKILSGNQQKKLPHKQNKHITAQLVDLKCKQKKNLTPAQCAVWICLKNKKRKHQLVFFLFYAKIKLLISL